MHIDWEYWTTKEYKDGNQLPQAITKFEESFGNKYKILPLGLLFTWLQKEKYIFNPCQKCMYTQLAKPIVHFDVRSN